MNDEPRHPLDVAQAVGQDVVAVSEGGGGDERVVAADHLASGHQLGEHSRVNAGNRKIERNDRYLAEHRLDEVLASSSPRGRVSAMHADEEFGRRDGGEGERFAGDDCFKIAQRLIASLQLDNDGGINLSDRSGTVA